MTVSYVSPTLRGAATGLNTHIFLMGTHCVLYRSGTSSWNSLTGRTANCVENIRQAVRSGITHGAVGMLLTDWGDYGHTQVRLCDMADIRRPSNVFIPNKSPPPHAFE